MSQNPDLPDMEILPDGFAFVTHAQGDSISVTITADGFMELTSFDDDGDEVASMAMPFDDWIQLMKDNR